MRYFRFMLIVGLLAVICSLSACRKPVWTKKEAADWYTKYSSMVRGGIGYQGSDAQSHHFIARVMDEWVFIQIPKSELKLDDERLFSPRSSAQLAYYAVDPSRDFQRLKRRPKAHQAVQRTGASRSAQRRIGYPGRLASAADLYVAFEP